MRFVQFLFFRHALVYHSGKKSTEQIQTFVLYFFSFALCYDQIFIKYLNEKLNSNST